MTEAVLDVQDLRTHYLTQDGVVVAVNGFSLRVEAGKMIGLVGESGCGKSTVALSVMRLLPKAGRIVGGRIELGGREILSLGDRAMRSLRGPEVAMVFQDALTALDPTMRVGQQLMEPLRVHLGLSLREARRRAVELLDTVGIPAATNRLDDYPHQLSGGMRQRVMIAIALSCRPSLLLADEPTTALDVTVQRQILDLILELRQQSGAGVVLITHDVGVVAATCDEVAVMYAGSKVESGPTQEVFTHPIHPYTIGLLGSTLRLGREKDKPLPAVPGAPPELIDPPPGCLFWPRCGQQTEICRDRTPDLKEVGADHVVACWSQDQSA